MPSEPRKVGLEVIGNPEPPPPGISLVKYVNTIHAPNPPGPNIPAGSNVVFTYLVTNTGQETLTDIVLVDDQIGTITCPKTTLAPGEAMTCTSTTQIAISGQYANIATVTGHPPSRATAHRHRQGPLLERRAAGHGLQHRHDRAGRRRPARPRRRVPPAQPRSTASGAGLMGQLRGRGSNPQPTD